MKKNIQVLNYGGEVMYIVLVYDIKLDEEGPRILRHTFKECKKYLHHVQNSVFEGEISKSKLIEFKLKIQKIIRKDKDSVIIFKSREERWLDKEIIGYEKYPTDIFI